MKNMLWMAAIAGLSILTTGCATKKYVTKTITPVEQRVAAAEGKLHFFSSFKVLCGIIKVLCGIRISRAMCRGATRL